MTWSNSAEECVAYKLSAREPTLNPAASSLTCACPVVSASPTDCVCRKAADARSKVGPRGKGGPADGLSPNSSGFRWCRAWGSIPVRRNRQVQREGWQHVSSLNATSCGLLKQPDKQELANRRRSIGRIREVAGVWFIPATLMRWELASFKLYSPTGTGVDPIFETTG